MVLRGGARGDQENVNGRYQTILGKKYRYQVAAVTEAGMSPWSEPSKVLKCPTKMEFIVIAHDRKKKAKEARAAAKLAKHEAKAALKSKESKDGAQIG